MSSLLSLLNEFGMKRSQKSVKLNLYFFIRDSILEKRTRNCGTNFDRSARGARAKLASQSASQPPQRKRPARSVSTPTRVSQPLVKPLLPVPGFLRSLKRRSDRRVHECPFVEGSGFFFPERGELSEGARSLCGGDPVPDVRTCWFL